MTIFGAALILAEVFIYFVSVASFVIIAINTVIKVRKIDILA